jgi:hypothetical protein
MYESNGDIDVEDAEGDNKRDRASSSLYKGNIHTNIRIKLYAYTYIYIHVYICIYTLCM